MQQLSFLSTQSWTAALNVAPDVIFNIQRQVKKYSLETQDQLLESVDIRNLKLRTCSTQSPTDYPKVFLWFFDDIMPVTYIN